MDVIVSKWMFFPFLSPNGCFREKLSTNGFSPYFDPTHAYIYHCGTAVDSLVHLICTEPASRFDIRNGLYITVNTSEAVVLHQRILPTDLFFSFCEKIRDFHKISLFSPRNVMYVLLLGPIINNMQVLVWWARPILLINTGDEMNPRK